ncbi:hypothetical protein [Pseudomonas tohonis]|uniref:DNA-binding protein n=1 Tax=Pseudomonas tohonis TaxID=2725477 RepID=A0ABQ4W0W4_9PSED|nr:hypothetical protein [Pseudomonas tohonis]GJN53072.1 hypothetical protein TUM20286_28240 [Pseudomonas tohonis]
MKATSPSRCMVCAREHFLCGDLTSPLRTLAQAKAAFHSSGISVTRWARDHRVHVNSVNEVIHGRKRCIRGDAHAIAVLLRLKNGDITEFLAARATPLHGAAAEQQ